MGGHSSVEDEVTRLMVVGKVMRRRMLIKKRLLAGRRLSARQLPSESTQAIEETGRLVVNRLRPQTYLAIPQSLYMAQYGLQALSGALNV